MAGHRLARRVENRELSDHRADVDSGSATGSIGSWIEPPIFSVTPASVSSSAMLRASVGMVRAGRAWAPRGCHLTGMQRVLRAGRAGPGRLVPVSPWSTQIRFGFTPRAVSVPRCAVRSRPSVDSGAYLTSIMVTEWLYRLSLPGHYRGRVSWDSSPSENAGGCRHVRSGSPRPVGR
jgi:hypothetical protein